MHRVDRIEIIMTVPSVEQTIAWYQRVLGWPGHQDIFDAEGRCLFGSVSGGDPQTVTEGKQTFIGFNLSRSADRGQPYGPCEAFTALVYVDDVDQVYQRVVAKGGRPEAPPENQMWGGRTFSLRDVNGFRLTFAQMVEDLSLDEIRGRQS